MKSNFLLSQTARSKGATEITLIINSQADRSIVNYVCRQVIDCLNKSYGDAGMYYFSEIQEALKTGVLKSTEVKFRCTNPISVEETEAPEM